MLEDGINPAGCLGFVKEEHVTLARIPVRRHVVDGVVVDGVEEKSVAVVEEISVVCRHAVGDAASGPDERLLAHSKVEIFPVKVSRPKEDPFDPIASISIRNR